MSDIAHHPDPDDGPDDEKKVAASTASPIYGAASVTAAATTTGSPRGSGSAWGATWSKFWKFVGFLGPGAVISVAYVDPDNYQTAISSGASFEYKLLFMVLVSNIIAIYLQVRAYRTPESFTTLIAVWQN